MIAQIATLITTMLLITGTAIPIQTYNQKPEVISLHSKKKTYEIGEPIELDYFFSNEQDEKVEERWTYKKEGDAPNNILYTKPEAIFAKGRYLVSLQLKDEKGNWGDPKECKIKIKNKLRQNEYSYKFGSAPIGTTIDNFEGVNYRDYESAEVNIETDKEGTLLMSNSPETVKQTGIMYQDTAKGEGRIMIHHINDMKDSSKRLVVLARNKNKKAIEFNVKNRIIKGPGKDVLGIGQQVLYEYFDRQEGEHIHLKENEIHVIYDSLGSKWEQGAVISGMIDFSTKNQVEYIVAVIDRDTVINEVLTLDLVKQDVHPRGTFKCLDKYYKVDLTNQEGNRKIILGSGKLEWVQGVDALTHIVASNRGNFGIPYHITITAKENTAVILNPRGNMFRGAIKWQGLGGYLVPKYGYFPDLNRAAYLGVVKAGETRELVYMLPAGSSAPIVIGFMPESNWNS